MFKPRVGYEDDLKVRSLKEKNHLKGNNQWIIILCIPLPWQIWNLFIIPESVPVKMNSEMKLSQLMSVLWNLQSCSSVSIISQDTKTGNNGSCTECGWKSMRFVPVSACGPTHLRTFQFYYAHRNFLWLIPIVTLSKYTKSVSATMIQNIKFDNWNKH